MDNNSNENLMWVKAGENSEGNRVAIIEHDERHPNGVAYVYGDKVKQVYPTEEVVLRVREGFLEEVRNYRPREEEDSLPDPVVPVDFAKTPPSSQKKGTSSSSVASDKNKDE